MDNKIKGFKVTDANMQCRGFQFELNTEYSEKGKIKACNNGFHFCAELKDCFNYYSFDPNNRVFEVEGYGSIDSESDKTCSEKIIFLKEISWLEVLALVNSGKGNTGIGNAGNRNAGNRNSGNRNSGNRNAGDYNSGYSNAGDYNSGNRNAGYSNAGDYNSGNRNAGYSNAGNDNAGAFNNLDKPNYIMFNKPSIWSYEDFTNSQAYSLLKSIDTNLWIPDYKMTKEEKTNFPYYATTSGYSKQLPYKECFVNAWNNWSEQSKQEFKNLPNFDAEIFLDITGVDVNIN